MWRSSGSTRARFDRAGVVAYYFGVLVVVVITKQEAGNGADG